MKEPSFKTLFFTVSLSWLLFYCWQAVMHSNQRYYPVPLSDVRFDSDPTEAGTHYALLPNRNELRQQGVEELYITEVPIASYRPIYGPLAVTVLALVIALVPRKGK